MIRSVLGSLIAASFLAFSQVQAGQIAQVVDATNFCTFLPPSDSTDRLISDTEWNGAVFCMGNTPKASSSGTLASGFIQSAHFVATDDYIQVTGQINPSKENLDLSDWGGQYDIKAPDGASCAGYSYFVNLVEPASYTYCIRCCNTVVNCNRGISEKGCAHIIPGDYSGPMDTSITGSTNAPSTSTTTSAAVAAASLSSKASANSSSASPAATTTKTASAASASSAVTTSRPITPSSQNAVGGSGSPATSAVVSSGPSLSDAIISSSVLSPSDSVSAQSVNNKSSATAIDPAGIAMVFAFAGSLIMVAI